MIKGIVTKHFDVSKRIGKMADVFENARNKAVQESTLAVHAEAIKLIQDNSDGKTMIRYAPKRVVNVSRPGDPPNTDTGRLAQSIKFDFSADGDVGQVGSNLKYAAWLEFGTINMSPRPWLSTAISNVNVAKIFAKWIEKALRKATS